MQVDLLQSKHVAMNEATGLNIYIGMLLGPEHDLLFQELTNCMTSEGKERNLSRRLESEVRHA